MSMQLASNNAVIAEYASSSAVPLPSSPSSSSAVNLLGSTSNSFNVFESTSSTGAGGRLQLPMNNLNNVCQGQAGQSSSQVPMSGSGSTGFMSMSTAIDSVGVKIFKFYDNVTDPPHTGENMRWKCRLCDSRISSSRRATSNLITHVQRKHPCEYAIYLKEKESTRVMLSGGASSTSGPNSNNIISCPSSSSSSNNRSSLNTTLTAITKYLSTLKYTDNDFQQVKLNDALIYMMADNLLPFSFVESSGFHHLMNVADVKYVPPSSKHMTHVLFPSKRRQVEDALRQLLRVPSQVCVTLDAWASGSSSSSTANSTTTYIVMSAHFIKQDWSFKSVLLSCHIVDGQLSCTGENVLQMYEEIAELFQIRAKVRHIVTDSSTYDSRVNDVLLNEGRANTANNSSMLTHVKQEFTSSTVIDGSDSPTRLSSTWPVEIPDTEMMKQLPERMQCFACCLQSVIKYSFQICRPIVGILNKIGTAVNQLRTQGLGLPTADQKFNNWNGFVSGMPSQAAATAATAAAAAAASNTWPSSGGSWQVQLKVARAFLRLPESILSTLTPTSTSTSTMTCLSTEEHAILSEFLEIMEPFEEAVDQFNQGNEQTVTVSNVIPCIRGLRLSLKSMRLNYCIELIERLAECIESELASTYECCDTFILGTIVDPRFKMDWCSPDEIVSLQAMLFHQMRQAVNVDASTILESSNNLQEQEQEQEPSENPEEGLRSPSSLMATGCGSGSSSSSSSLNNLNKRPKLFCYMSGSFTTSFRDPYRDTEERIAQEISHYLASKCVPHSFDPLGWWRCHVLEFPILASIARNILSVCASASAAQQIIDRRLIELAATATASTARHSDVNNEHFESMIFLKSNAFL